MLYNKIKLSDSCTIYRAHDENFQLKKQRLLELISVNRKFVKLHSGNSVIVEIRAKELDKINSEIKSIISDITGRDFINYAENYWIYTQTKGFDLEWMHQHILVHPLGRTTFKTDFTFTYYVQTPKDIKGDEGHIVFQTEDKKLHKYLPEEGDIFIFPADLRHTAIPTPESDIDRLVYAGSLCIDIENQKDVKKSII